MHPHALGSGAVCSLVRKLAKPRHSATKRAHSVETADMRSACKLTSPHLIATQQEEQVQQWALSKVVTQN